MRVIHRTYAVVGFGEAPSRHRASPRSLFFWWSLPALPATTTRNGCFLEGLQPGYPLGEPPYAGDRVSPVIHACSRDLVANCYLLLALIEWINRILIDQGWHAIMAGERAVFWRGWQREHVDALLIATVH